MQDFDYMTPTRLIFGKGAVEKLPEAIQPYGEGLAIITPCWMRHILSEKTLPRFVKYGVNVFGIDATLPPREIAEKAIQATYDFFASIGIPMTLREVGIDSSRIDEMAHHVIEGWGLKDAWVPLSEADIAAIFRASLYPVRPVRAPTD